MSPISSGPKSTKNGAASDNEIKTETRSPFETFIESDVLLSPYRALSRALLHTHRNTAAFVEINRKFADELRDVIRRQQEFALKLSEDLIRQLPKGMSASKQGRELPRESFGKYFESAIAGARECGQGFADVQVHAFEAFQEQAREMAKLNGHSAGHSQAAE